MNAEISQSSVSKRNIIIIAIMLSGAFIAVLNQTVLSPALPSIMRDLHITAAEGQWLTTAFMLVNGIMIPITAFLINRFTTRQIFIASMLIFSVGTTISGFAPSFFMLLIGRILQAVAAGILMPMIQTTLLLIFPREKRGSAMGVVGIVMAFAPAVGPTLAGWIVDAWGWSMIFRIIAPLAVLDVLLAVFVLNNVGETTKPKLDVFSVILSSFGFGGLLYGCSAIGSSSGSGLAVVLPLLVGCICLILFFRRQLHLDEPLLEIKVFRSSVFTYATIIGMIINAAFIAGTIIMPIYFQNILKFSAMQSGLIMLPGSIIMGFMSPITGNLFDRFGPRILSIIGLFIMTATTTCFIFLNENCSFAYICTIYTLRLFGISMVMMPLNTWGLNSLENHYIAHGSAIYNTMRQVAGSIGTAILITIMVVSTKLTEASGFVSSTLHGMRMAFITATVLTAIALLLAILVVRNRTYEGEEEF